MESNELRFKHVGLSSDGAVIFCEMDNGKTYAMPLIALEKAEDWNPKAKPKEGEKTPYQRLTDALANGKKITSVTGRVQGWSGRWPVVLRELAGETENDAKSKTATNKRTLVIVKDFEIAKA